MSLKINIKNYVSKNSYLNYYFYKLLACKNEKAMKGLVEVIKKNDCIEDTSILRSFRYEVSNGAEFSTKNANMSNARVYGIWKSLFPFCDEKEAHLTPSIEHGLILHDAIYPDICHSARMCAVTMSPFRKTIIQKHKKIPVFCCGPYIQYAEPWYNEYEEKELKRKLGRTLLVFPCHSTDASVLTLENRRYLERVATIAKDYDTVIVNAFWWNINDSIIKDFQEKGYRIVSAGFRDDPSFLRRLRTIISLADFVVGDSVGTHIGYCIQLGKPFSLIEVGAREKLLSADETNDYIFHNSCIKEIEDAFKDVRLIDTNQRNIAEKYWGLGISLTEEERCFITDCCRKLTKETRGFTANSVRAGNNLLRSKWTMGNNDVLLRDALRC